MVKPFGALKTESGSLIQRQVFCMVKQSSKESLLYVQTSVLCSQAVQG